MTFFSVWWDFFLTFQSRKSSILAKKYFFFFFNYFLALETSPAIFIWVNFLSLLSSSPTTKLNPSAFHYNFGLATDPDDLVQAWEVLFYVLPDTIFRSSRCVVEKLQESMTRIAAAYTVSLSASFSFLCWSVIFSMKSHESLCCGFQRWQLE